MQLIGLAPSWGVIDRQIRDCKKTIEANHVMMIRPGTMPGRADGNPMREDIENGYRKISNLVLIKPP